MTAYYKQIFGENLSITPFLLELSSIDRLFICFLPLSNSFFFFFLCTFIYATDDFVFIWMFSVIASVTAQLVSEIKALKMSVCVWATTSLLLSGHRVTPQIILFLNVFEWRYKQISCRNQSVSEWLLLQQEQSHRITECVRWAELILWCLAVITEHGKMPLNLEAVATNADTLLLATLVPWTSWQGD